MNVAVGSVTHHVLTASPTHIRLVTVTSFLTCLAVTISKQVIL